MTYLYDGTSYYVIFPDGIKFSIDKDLWERIKKLKEQGAL